MPLMSCILRFSNARGLTWILRYRVIVNWLSQKKLSTTSELAVG
jgi:hypothetical protein